MKNTLYFLFVSILLATLSCASEQSNTSEVDALKQQIADADAKIKSMDTPQTGLIHTVFFWLKDDLTAEQKAKFKAGVQSLTTISHIQQSFTGPAAGTESRDVVDHSYDLALICHFADQAAQDAYQIDPVHLKFVDDCKDLWSKVVVYDSLVE